MSDWCVDLEINFGSLLFSLRNRKAEEWGSVVTVVSCDMREWKAPEQVCYAYTCVCVCSLNCSFCIGRLIFLLVSCWVHSVTMSSLLSVLTVLRDF